MDNELEFDGAEIDETDEAEMDELTENLEAEATDPAAEETTTSPEAEAAPVDAAPLQRVFKVGSVRIPENDATIGKTVDQVKALLKSTYPEVANATPRVGIVDGIQLVEFLPQPGRKG